MGLCNILHQQTQRAKERKEEVGVQLQAPQQNLEDFAYPIPNKEYLMSKINNARWFSKFDLKSGFLQMAI